MVQLKGRMGGRQLLSFVKSALMNYNVHTSFLGQYDGLRCQLKLDAWWDLEGRSSLCMEADDWFKMVLYFIDTAECVPLWLLLERRVLETTVCLLSLLRVASLLRLSVPSLQLPSSPNFSIIPCLPGPWCVLTSY